jgi:hypothetical protein
MRHGIQATSQQVDLNVFMVCLIRKHSQRFAIRVNHHHVASQSHTGRVPIHVVNLARKSLRKRYVVCIHLGHKLSAGNLDTFVEPGNAPSMGLCEESDARVLACEPLKDLKRTVLRTIIEDEKLKILEGLGQNAFDRCGDIPLSVVHWRYY